jgi:hypothetical protein
VDRIQRNINNRKQDKISLANSQPSLRSMRDGEESLYLGRDGILMRYRREKGVLWKTQMTKDGSLNIDKNLSVGGSINLKNKIITNNYPAFSVYQSTSVDGQAIASSSSTFYRIILDTEHYDNGSHFDVSNYKFTVPYNGIYHFDANVLMDSNIDTDAGDWADESRIDIHLYKNQGDATTTSVTNRIASSLHLLPGAITDNFWQGNLSADLKLETGDFIELYVKQNSGVEQHTHEPTGGDYTRFTGHLVCAL